MKIILTIIACFCSLFCYSQQVSILQEDFSLGIPATWSHYSTNWGNAPQWTADSGAIMEASGPYFGAVSNWIQLPPVNLNSISNPVLKLDLAMAVIDTNIHFSIWFTRDTVWNKIATFGSDSSGADYVVTTYAASNNNWKPTASQYQQIELDLAQFTNDTNIRFSLCSHYLNAWAYGVWSVDNVQISGNFVTGISNKPRMNQILIFPNPSNGICNINFSYLDISGVLRIIDTKGKVILEHRIEKDEPQLQLQELSKGLYIVSYYAKNKIFHGKFCVH